ncbi:MAG: putative DNA modification/repair radical SAM protein [Candidatus Hermodarchaeota archaeon]
MEKLRILAESAKYDICASTASPRKVTGTQRIGNTAIAGICQSFTPDGRCVSLFKVLLSNYCQNDCAFCFTRSVHCRKKAEFEPKEIANLFMNLYIRNYVEGLFLSSGIRGSPERIQEKIVETAELLRNNYQFQGYMHLKIMPGAPRGLLNETARLADRASVNLEASNKQFFSESVSTMNYSNDILARVSWLRSAKKAGHIKSGHTTQFVVGYVEEPDKSILTTSDHLYRYQDLKRAYFSAYGSEALSHQIIDKHKLREHRLYQADWLMRVYKIPLKELFFKEEGNLPLRVDPKFAMALEDVSGRFPAEINEAPYEDLIRVPGLGPKSAQRIIRLRESGEKINSAKTLHTLGVVTKRALPFVSINDKRQTRIEEHILPSLQS